MVFCRAGDTGAACASHLMHFATAGEAISNAVPGAGAVPSARACELAEPKGAAASIVLAGKAKGCCEELLQHLNCCLHVGAANSIQPTERKPSNPPCLVP